MMRPKNVDSLSDDELRAVNDILPWQTFTLDSRGRAFGKSVSDTKRSAPQAVPDHRLVDLNHRLLISGKSVLEVGCLEGIHSVALSGLGAKLTAIDARVENLIKTNARLWGYGLDANVVLCDAENVHQLRALGAFDITIHIGVLYHLRNPVSHLIEILRNTRTAILLDTHFCPAELALLSDFDGGYSYNYMHFIEGGRDQIYAGMYDHAKWLTLDFIREVIEALGFVKLEVVEIRNERFGPRALIYASRS